MGAWARPGCAEIGSKREGRTGFLADPLASVLDAASENSLMYSSSRPLLKVEMYTADPVHLTSVLAVLPGRQCHCR